MSVIDILKIRTQSDVEARKRELELKERAMALEERKLALQEQQFAFDQAERHNALRPFNNNLPPL